MISLTKSLIPLQSRQKARAYVGLPTRLLKLINHYLYDLIQFSKHSSALQFFSSAQQQRAWIDADAHKLEKGLALEHPRPGFGKAVAERLIRHISLYRENYKDDLSISNAVKVLSVYRKFNLSHGTNYSQIAEAVEQLELSCDSTLRGGYEYVEKDQWLQNAKCDLNSFFKSRRSVRDFSKRAVNIADIEKAMEMARYTPTVCNRQAVKVHAYTEYEEVQKVISCQLGNAGFGHKVNSLLVVTVDRQSFFSEHERNQCWIDGGLFSMSLVYALHSLGLATCCLNWSVDKTRDRLLRRTIKLDDGDAVIMMIAVGHLKDQFKVATSARKPVSQILIKGLQH